ncbi:cytochrome c family protein, partial [Cellulomonas hominis]
MADTTEPGRPDDERGAAPAPTDPAHAPADPATERAGAASGEAAPDPV